MPEEREFSALFARRMNEALRASRDDGIRFLWVDDIVLAEIPPAGAPTEISSTAWVSENDSKSFVEDRLNLSFSDAALSAYGERKWADILARTAPRDWLRINKKELRITF